MKCPQQIFSSPQIYTGLAADRGINLGQYCCGNLHQINPAHVEGGEQPGGISHHSATEGNNHGITIGPEPQHFLRECFHGGQFLVRLTVAHFDDLRVKLCSSERTEQLLAPAAANLGHGDDEYLLGLTVRGRGRPRHTQITETCACAIQQAVFDYRLVWSRSNRDSHSLHGAFHHNVIASEAAVQAKW